MPSVKSLVAWGGHAAFALLAVTVASCTQLDRTAHRSPTNRPNVIVILADDLGYADLGVQGCTDVPTPRIDSLAANGIRFTNGYVSCPVCSPTRAGFMTGRYQQRFGHEFNPGPVALADPKFGLPLTEVTIADRMRALGYATGMVGKWHLGYKPEFHPLHRGFDEFFGFIGGAHNYIDEPGKGDATNPILRGTQPVDEREYTTLAFAREAAAFIDRHAKEPFFLYVPFNAVHAPLQGLDAYRARFASIDDDRRRTYAAMLAAMDDAVGRILDVLRERQLEENTLIVFFSDNGGPTPSTTSRNDPLSGFKGSVLEGGIRIPFIIQWKGHLRAGVVCDVPIISLDICPTAVAAAGGTIPADAHLDGVNLLPYLTGERTDAPHDRLFWRYGHQWAVRVGDWKLLQMGASPALYNLGEDISEKNDLSAKMPDKVNELKAVYDAWNAQLMEPLWQVPRPAATTTSAPSKPQARNLRQRSERRRARQARPGATRPATRTAGE